MITLKNSVSRYELARSLKVSRLKKSGCPTRVGASIEGVPLELSVADTNWRVQLKVSRLKNSVWPTRVDASIKGVPSVELSVADTS